jgi:PST family polysaccharide transporter
MERLVGAGVTWKLAGQIAIQVIRLLTVAVLARLLTPHDYGAAAVAIALASFAPQLADMGLGSALVQAETAPARRRSTAFWASIVSGFGLFAIMAAAAVPVSRFMDEPEVAGMVIAGGLTFAIYSVGSASQSIYVREMRFRSAEVRSWLALVTGGVIAIVAAAAGAGPWALALQQIGYMTLLVGAFWFRAGWHPTLEFSRTMFRELWSFAIRIAGGRWARLFELLVLTVLIGGLASVADLGAWSFGMSMVILPLSLVAIPIAEVLFSAFSRLQNEPERMAALWLDSIGYLAAVILPVMFGLMIISPDLIPAVFGERWEVSVIVVQILSISVLIRALQSWGSVYMDAVGRPEVTFWTQLASLCLTPVAVVIGVHWGIGGVAACYVLAQLIAVEIPMFVIVLRQMRLSLRTLAARVSGVVLAAVLMALACALGRAALVEAGVDMTVRAAATILLGIVIYLPAMWWLAPGVTRSVYAAGRNRVTKLAVRRRAVLQPEH